MKKAQHLVCFTGEHSHSSSPLALIPYFTKFQNRGPILYNQLPPHFITLQTWYTHCILVHFTL